MHWPSCPEEDERPLCALPHADFRHALHDKAFDRPFSEARVGERYAAVLTTMEDMVYLDMADRR